MDNKDYIDCQWFYIGDYILNSLHRLGITDIFGIPGDYVLDFVELIEKHDVLKFINTCDENGAAIAADAYARVNNAGCLCITYGVGGLKTVNALANAYVEKSPVILISGAPPIYEKSKFNDRFMLHHEVAKNNTQLKMVKEVTCYQAVLSDPFTVIHELDNAFDALKKNSQPIYIELPKDFTFEKAYYFKTPSPSTSDPNFTSSLWEAASEIIHIIKNSEHAIVMVGLEVGRFQVKHQVYEFIERTQIPFCTTVMGKSSFGENHRLFAGCYVGKMSNKEIYNYVESRDCCIMMGVQVTDTVSGIFSSKRFLKNDDNIKLNMNGIQVNNHCYHNINMIQVLDLILNSEEFQEDLNEIYSTRHAYRHPVHPPSPPPENQDHPHDDQENSDEEKENKNTINDKSNRKKGKDKDEIKFSKSSQQRITKTNLPSSFLKKLLNFEPSNKPLSNDIVYRIINRWINSNTTVVCDVGDPSFGTYDLFIPKGAIYLNPAIYLSLGFGVPGGLGACAARPTRRTIVICGDGGFQMTCQEISVLARYHLHPIIIILNNNGYTTERGLNQDIRNANTIPFWDYSKLIELVGTGRYIGNIKTEKDLDLALRHCFDMASIFDSITTADTTSSDTEDNGNVEKGENKVNKDGSTIIDKIYCKEKKCLIPSSKYWIPSMKGKGKSKGKGSTTAETKKEEDNSTRGKKRKEDWKKEEGKENINKNNDSDNENYYWKDSEEEEEEEGPGKPSYLKLKSNYLTIIEIKLEEMGMSYGTQRFISLSQKKRKD